ncbi:hypothetical protein BBJ28_00021096 [Nothophytophthora sp. Chile5]|nr:hypothetical protein BBJ28_00021096 [Nothophytophthora sp. Chile5]
MENAEEGQTLVEAARSGSVQSVKKALEFGIDVDALSSDHRTALMAASQYGYTDVVEALLANKANIDTKLPDGTTALYIACEHGHVGAVQALLASGAAIELADDEGFTALMAASEKGYTAVVEALLANKANIDTKLPDGTTALYIACEHGHVGAVQALLASGAAIELADDEGFTALMAASQYGYTDVVEALLANKANIDIQRSNGDTALNIACFNGQVGAVRALLKVGAAVELADGQGYTALMAASQKGHTDVVELLLANKANLDTQRPNGDTALKIACEHGRVGAVRSLLASGAAIELVGHRDFTALMVASEFGHTEVVELLLANNASVNTQRPDGATGLYSACYNAHVGAARALLASGAAIELATNQGFTPLMRASQFGHTDVVELLLANKANIDTKFPNGATALNIACFNGQVGAVQALLASGAAIELATDQGYTALMAASQKGHTDVVELLLANEANVDTQRPNGATALNIACQYGQVGAVRALLASGAATELADDQGFTALMSASLKGHTDVVELLLANEANVDTQRPNGATALFIACQYGRVGAVRALLASSSAIELADDQGFTALMAASRNGHTDVVELLLATKTSPVDWTPEKGIQGTVALGRHLKEKLKEASKIAGNRSAIAGCWRDVKEQLLAYEGESRLLIKLADTARVVSFLERATNTALGILNLLGSPDGISWHQALDREREDRVEFFEALLADDKRMAREMGDKQQQLEVLTRLKHGFERYGDVLNSGELDVMSAVFDAVVRCADVVVAAVPQWFALSKDEWSRAEASPVDEGEEVCVRDASFLALLNHPNVRKFYGACHVANAFVIHEESYSLDSRGATWNYLLGCAHGLAYVHEQGLVHRGLSVNHLLRSYTSKKGILSGMGLVRRQGAGHGLTEADAERERESRSPEMSNHANDPSVSSDILAFGLAIFDLLAINYEIGVAASPDESYKEKRERVDIARKRVRQQPTEQLPATQPDYVKEAEWNLLLGMCAADPAARTNMEDVVYQVGVLAQQENIGHSSTTETLDTSPATVDDVSLYEIQSLGMTLRETLDKADELCSELETFHDVNRAVCARLVDVYEQLESTRTPLSASLVESFSLILMHFYEMLEKSYFEEDSIVASTCAAHTVFGKIYTMHHDIDRLIYNSPVLESTSGVHRWRPNLEQARQRQQKAMQTILENSSSALEEVALLQFSARESGISSLGNTTPLAQLGGISAEMLPQWFIPAHHVELGHHIASGAFGAVYRGEWLGTDVVVKQVLTDQENKENRAQFRQEIDLWFSLNHEHLIKLYGACHEGQPFFVCERASQGTILSYVKGFTRSTAWRYLRDAAEGLQHLHDHGIVHGDLKGNNILVSDDIAKLADFGLSIIASREEASGDEGALGAFRWKAPECLMGSRPTFASDIYSFGMCIIEVLTGKFPWGNSIPDEVVIRNVTKKLIPARPEDFSDAEWDLVTRMCSFEPELRMNAGAVVNCAAYFANRA